MKEFCEAFPQDEFYLSVAAVEEAVRRRRQFNVIHPRSGNKLDFMLARFDPWGREQLRRRRQRAFLPDLSAYAASPEDVIIAKMIYYREGRSDKHTRDIAGMLRISGPEIDRAYIMDWAEKLGLSDIWRMIIAETEKDRISDESL